MAWLPHGPFAPRLTRPTAVRYATLPIIAMTALAMAQDAEDTKAAGMNDHVTKAHRTRPLDGGSVQVGACSGGPDHDDPDGLPTHGASP